MKASGKNAYAVFTPVASVNPQHDLVILYVIFAQRSIKVMANTMKGRKARHPILCEFKVAKGNDGTKR